VRAGHLDDESPEWLVAPEGVEVRGEPLVAGVLGAVVGLAGHAVGDVAPLDAGQDLLDAGVVDAHDAQPVEGHTVRVLDEASFTASCVP